MGQTHCKYCTNNQFVFLFLSFPYFILCESKNAFLHLVSRVLVLLDGEGYFLRTRRHLGSHTLKCIHYELSQSSTNIFWFISTLCLVSPQAGQPSVCLGWWWMKNRILIRVTHSKFINYELSQSCTKIFWFISTLRFVWPQAGQLSVSYSWWWAQLFWVPDSNQGHTLKMYSIWTFTI